MTSGFRLARAEYSAAVRPAGPDPMMMTFLRQVNADAKDNAIGNRAFDITDVLVDDLLERVLVGEADDLLDDLAALEEQQRRNAADAEARLRSRGSRPRSACR